MKKFILIMLVIVLLLVFTTSALAGGDKNMGEKGKGEVNKNMEAGRGPFERPDCSGNIPPEYPCRPFFSP